MYGAVLLCSHFSVVMLDNKYQGRIQEFYRGGAPCQANCTLRRSSVGVVYSYYIIMTWT